MGAANAAEKIGFSSTPLPFLHSRGGHHLTALSLDKRREAGPGLPPRGLAPGIGKARESEHLREGSTAAAAPKVTASWNSSVPLFKEQKHSNQASYFPTSCDMVSKP